MWLVLPATDRGDLQPLENGDLSTHDNPGALKAPPGEAGVARDRRLRVAGWLGRFRHYECPWGPAALVAGWSLTGTPSTWPADRHYCARAPLPERRSIIARMTATQDEGRTS